MSDMVSQVHSPCHRLTRSRMTPAACHCSSCSRRHHHVDPRGPFSPRIGEGHETLASETVASGVVALAQELVEKTEAAVGLGIARGRPMGKELCAATGTMRVTDSEEPACCREAGVELQHPMEMEGVLLRFDSCPCCEAMVRC